jgi:hypothetical protein
MQEAHLKYTGLLPLPALQLGLTFQPAHMGIVLMSSEVDIIEI